MKMRRDGDQQLEVGQGICEGDMGEGLTGGGENKEVQRRLDAGRVESSSRAA